MSRQKKRRSQPGNESLHDDHALEDALTFFIELRETVKLRGNVLLMTSVGTVQKHGLEHGLSPQHIQQLMGVICRNKLPDSVCHKIIRSLIPASTVPADAIVSAVSWMCTNKPSSTTQTLLVRWMVLIYEFIDNTDKIHALYGFIFYFLQNESMCRHACHLLYLMTRREDVKLFRVQALVHLQNRMGAQSYILGLMSVYKLYCPHMVTMVIPTRWKMFFPQTDRQWASQIREIHGRLPQAQHVAGGDAPEQTSYSLSTSIKIPVSGKRGRKEFIPEVGSRSQSLPEKTTDKIPFAQIRSFKQMLQNLERLELPSQMAAVLKDENLQYILLCNPDPTIATRLAYWLDHVLSQEFLEGPGNKDRQEELLVKLINFSDFLQEGVPACENFLTRYLHTWNGLEHRSYILKLITRFRLYKFDELHNQLLEPLRKLYYSSSVYCKCQILLCLAELVRNFAAVELQRYKNCLRLQKERDNVAQSFLEQCDSVSVFSEKVEEFDALYTIAETVRFTDDLCVMGSRLEKQNVLFMHCSLWFYEMVTGLTTRHNIPVVVLPSRAIIYCCLFSHTPMLLLRLCSLICSYGVALQSICNLNVSQLSTEERAGCTSSTVHIQKLNRYILDLCDSLWRGRAVSSQEKDSVYRLLDSPTAQKLLPPEPHHSLSLRYHPALLGYTRKFFKEHMLPPSAYLHGPWKQYRDQHLEYLEDSGAYGVKHFIRTFMKRQHLT